MDKNGGVYMYVHTNNAQYGRCRNSHRSNYESVKLYYSFMLADTIRKKTYCGNPAFSVRPEKIDSQMNIKRLISKNTSLGTYAPRKFIPQRMADLGQVK